MGEDTETTRVRTLFLSDMHLGTKGCQADLLLEFLRDYDADEIYLVGDIVDGWQLKSGWYWPQSHNDVVQKLMRKVRKGSTLVYVPGNHDEFLRDYIGMTFGGIEIADQRMHEAADGKRYLVIHGDQFDMVVRHAKWLAYPGRRRLHLRALHQHLRQHGAPPPRPRLLVALGLGEAEGEERRQLHRQVRGTAQRRGQARRRRRCDLRPHPPRGQPPDRRADLPQHRRLGGILHRHRRALRRHHGGAALSEPAARPRRAGPSWSSIRGPTGPGPSREAAHRHRCLAPAGQRRRPLPGEHGGGRARLRLRPGLPDPPGFRVPAPAGLSRDPAGLRHQAPRRPPLGRPAPDPRPHLHGGDGRLRHPALLPRPWPALHDELSHPVSRNTFPPAPPCRKPGATPGCAASTAPSNGTMVSHALPGARPRRPRLHQPDALDARASTPTCSARRRAKRRSLRTSPDLPRPIFLSVGRLAVEKNLDGVPASRPARHQGRRRRRARPGPPCGARPGGALPRHAHGRRTRRPLRRRPTSSCSRA